MNKVIASLVLSCFAIATLTAQEVQPRQIVVYGTATTEVVPNQMIWSVEVRTRNKALEAAADEHTKTVQVVLDLLKDLKVEQKNIQTSRMEFGENWEYMSSSRVKSGYYASTAISFKVTDLDLYKKLWLDLSKISGVSVQDVRYDHSDRIEYRNTTRQKALRAAREKASVMAHTLDADILETLTIEEDLSVNESWLGNRVFANATENNVRSVADEDARGQEALSPGTIAIRARVKVAFRLR